MWCLLPSMLHIVGLALRVLQIKLSSLGSDRGAVINCYVPCTHTAFPDDLICYQKFLLKNTSGPGSARIAVLLQHCSKAVSQGWRGRFQRADHWPPCSLVRWGVHPTPRGPAPRLVEEAAGIGVFVELSGLGNSRQQMIKAENLRFNHNHNWKNFVIVPVHLQGFEK